MRQRSPVGQGSAGARIAGTVLALWFCLPLVPLLVWAVADRWSWPAAYPQQWGLRGWSDVAEQGAPAAALRSAGLGLAVAALATPIGALAGRVLGWRLTHRPVLTAVILLVPVALPPFALAMGVDVVLLRLRAPESAAVVLLLTVSALPYTALVFRAAYASLDPDIDGQARMLGATAAQSFRRVTWPMLGPAAVTAAALAFLVGWSDYIVTLVIGGGQLATVPMLLGAAASGTGNEPSVAVLSLVSTLPLLAVGVLAIMLVRRRSARRWAGRSGRVHP